MSVKWSPISVLPDVDQDVLLYLCLMGDAEFVPFQRVSDCKAIENVTLMQAIEDMRGSVRSKQLQLLFDNTAQVVNDGQLLEAAQILAIVLASRCNGIAGASLGQFVLCVATHLQHSYLELQLDKLPQDIASLNMTVPCFAPPN